MPDRGAVELLSKDFVIDPASEILPEERISVISLLESKAIGGGLSLDHIWQGRMDA